VKGLRIKDVNALVLHRMYRKEKKLRNEAMSDRKTCGVDRCSRCGRSRLTVLQLYY